MRFNQEVQRFSFIQPKYRGNFYTLRNAQEVNDEEIQINLKRLQVVFGTKMVFLMLYKSGRVNGIRNCLNSQDLKKLQRKKQRLSTRKRKKKQVMQKFLITTHKPIEDALNLQKNE